jgi:hypothetical protein
MKPSLLVARDDLTAETGRDVAVGVDFAPFEAYT